MASRRQKQFERKYSSYRKYTATEDVNYSTHSSRSSYRSESLTSRQDGRSRSTSTEVTAGSETRSYPVYIAIQDYSPETTEVESIALEQGQIVEVLDKKNSARWLVRTKARPPQSGWVPGSYFETPTEYYKQRRRTREIEGKDSMTEEQQATLKRDQVYHDLLNSEEEFVANLRSCVDFYITALDSADLPAEILTHREQLALNVAELYNFHANVLLKGLNYYSDDPGKVGQTFVRLERDFEQHVHFFRELPSTLKLLDEPKIREFFEARANTCEAGASSFAERLQQVADRMTQYQNFFKEFVKYASRAQHSTRSVQKALELVLSVPQRINELQFTKNIKEYPGDTSRLGRLIRHDPFKVDDGEGPKERYVFMFKNKLMVTEKLPTEPVTYKHCATIRLDKYAVRTHTGDEDTLVLKPTDPGLPAFTMAPANLEEAEFVRKGWLRDIAEEHEAYAAERAETETVTATEGFDALTASDMRSEFSEYTGTSSRKSSLRDGPDEGGTPRKKIKSPPVISPTGSTTSIYSGGSSSIDWTTTGTTLEMQGTRVTRTQYGFRTLQESSAKMCLKVTGYPLPEITWYKDDVQLHEDERHTFYADEDGFFAMTIDPVQVEDTGRYTCMATNEYGQASTSAFFRVLKVEKEAAPPKFVNSLRDQECKEGEVCSFECEVEGWPEPELLWLVDDQPLRPSHDFRLQYDGQKATLEIRDAQPDDTGVYTVKIQNEFGTAESKAELLVEPDPDKNHVAPEFQATIEDVECKEGDEVRFKAVYTGDPTPEIVWLINGYPLTESEKIKFINEDGICILTIKDVTRHFDGIVTCQAANRLGSEQCTARLKVIVPPAPPTFNKLLEDKTVIEKNTAVFEVDVSGWPEPKVVFTLKGKELKHGEDGVEISGADGYFRVAITNCQQDIHEGEIVARASNDHGTAESRARLTVELAEEESRSAPTFLKDIEDQTVKHGEQAVFETTVSGSPNPEVTWFINGHKMDPTSPGVKIEVINHDHKLTIDSAQYAGTVLCRAENVVGRFETKARLVVLPQEKQKKPPRFVETLKDVTETEQNTVVFEVRVEGEPMPTVKWFLNEKELTTSSDSRVDIREFDGSIKLELRNISLTDAGEINAVATNSEGTAESSSKLIVKRKPFPPTFTKSPQSVTVEKGEWAEFSAHADGEPAPEYQWSVDGRKIRDTTEGAQIRVENGTAILRINTAIFSSSATVSITAENSLGVDETGARLTVSDEAERRRKEEEERKRKEEEEARKRAEEEAKRKAEEEEARRKAEEEEARRKAEEDARRKAEEEEAERRKREAEEASKPAVVTETNTVVTTVEARSEASSREFKVDIETIGGDGSLPAIPVLPVHVVTERDSVTTSQESKAEMTREGPVDVESTVTRTVETKETILAIPVPETQELVTETKTTLTRTIQGVRVGEEGEEVPVGTETTVLTKTTVTSSEVTGEPEADTRITVTRTMELVGEPGGTVEQAVPLENKEPVKIEETKTEVTVSVGQEQAVPLETKEPIKTEEQVTVTQETKAEVTVAPAPVQEQAAAPLETKETAPAVPTAQEEPAKEAAAPEEAKPKEEPTPIPAATTETTEAKPTVAETACVETPQVSAEPLPNGIPAGGTIEVGKIEVCGGGAERIEVPTITVTEPPKVEEEKPKEKAEETAAKDKAAPRVTRELQTQMVSRGDLAHFEAVIENAKTVRWYHNGKELTASTHGVKISQDENFEFRLSLDSSVFNEGDVKIVGENTLGTATSQAEMKIVEQMREFKKPEFTDKLRDMAVYKDEPFQMDVIALNSPIYQWFMNGKELKDGENGVRIVQEENKCSLRFDKALPEHDGAQVRVTATNEVGTSECDARLTLKERPTAPVISDGPSDTTAKEGGEAEFKVKVTGHPEPTIKWYINEQIVEESRTRLITRSGGYYFLTLKEIKVTESGTVKVTASNEAGTAEKTAKLVVEKKVTVPEFAAKLQEKTVNEGEKASWDVKIENPSPDTTLKWYINGKELAPKDGVEISDDGNGNYKLTVTASPDMDGTLTVKASNEAGTVEDSAKVHVKTAQKKPEITKMPQNHDTTIDESVKFSAIVEGIPTPQISWFLNGKKLEDGPDAHVKHEPETGKTSVRIHKPKLEDSGQIKVVADNALGKAEATAELKVERKMDVPKFTTNMDDRQVDEGSTVKYTSTVEGYPLPTIEWQLNGEPVSKHPNIKISDDGINHTIEITDIQKAQEGELSCQATNSVGFKKQNVQLAVKIIGEAPTFTKNLQDLLVTEGELTLMEARLKVVKPKPKITWIKDGKEFTSDDHWKLEEKDDGTLTLKIVTTDMNDKCRITIKAENHFGAAECAASLGVVKKVPMAKPAFQSEIAPISIVEGDSLQTKLLITGNPTPFVKWYINGQMVCETEDTEISNANGVYSLTIHGCTADMTGKIKCTAYNKAGEVFTEGQLKVTKPIPVEFETSLCDATCREGDTLKLKAVLLGEPTPVVSWYVNGKKLEETQNIKIHAEKGTYTVTIKDITCDYSGKVVCEAVNEYGKASSEAMLLVLPRGEPPDFLEWLSNVRARQGSKVVHKVVFTGDPKPTLTWYINNKEVTAGGDISIVTDDKTSILTIHNFNPDIHVGEIICKAENDAGEVSCTANMATYTSDMFSESESDAQLEEYGVEDQATDEESFREDLKTPVRTPTPVMAPKFITKIKDVKAKKGGEAIFECVVPDTKGVVCKWLKDGKEIELIARIRVQSRTVEGSNQIAHELIIEDVQPEDVGRYTVIVENSAGKDVCEANLTIIEALEKPSQKAPEFTTKLQDQRVETSERVVFECKVAGEPKPSVSWYHETVKIEESSVVKIETIDEVQRLTINSAELKDKGKYSCVAENVAGSSKTEASLEVTAEAPTFTKPLEDKTLSVGEKLILSCSVKGQPQPHVEFYRGETRLLSSDRISVEHDKTLTHWRFVITHTSREELDCVYRAVAANSAGSATSESKVAAKTVAPVFEQGLKRVSVKEKEEIRMEVKVSGTAPDVSFEKDGQPVLEDSNHKIEKNPETGAYALTIREAVLADAGKYTAKATNPAGAAESTAEAEVSQALEAPVWVKELASTEVKEKTTVTLSATVKGVPEPEVKWQKDGEPVTVDGSHLVSQKGAQGEYSLTIKEARKEDAGRYRAEAVNPAGKAETSCEVKIAKVTEAPRFTEELRSLEVKEKETLTLSVTVIGEPAPSVTWKKDNVPVNIDNSHIFSKDEGNGHYTLTIKDALKTDVGSYSAVATNEVGVATSSCELKLAKILEAPRFIEELRSLEVKEKESLTLSVTVVGEPAPTVTWKKDNTPVNIDGAHVISKDEGNGHYTLTIKDALKTDVGSYSAVATNEVGVATSSCELKLAKILEGPRFTEELRNLEVKEKETLTLSVTVIGEPAPSVTWKKDDTPVNVDNSHIFSKDEGNGHYTLTIKDARLTDVGSYSCTATNPVGQATTEAKMGVVEELTAPHFVEGLRPLETEEGKPAELTVTVEGKPEPEVVFLKDGVPVSQDAEHEVRKDAEGHHVLVIKAVSQKDVGQYTCVAQNKAGREESLGELKIPRYSFEKVKEEEIAPLFIEPLKEATVTEGQEVVLECRVNKDSQPEIRWFLNEKPVHLGAHMEAVMMDDGLVKLTIHGARAEDIGNYRCEAVNKVGSAKTTAELKYAKESKVEVVEERLEEFAEMKLEEITEKAVTTAISGRGPPEFIELLRSCTVTIGETAVLKCRVKGEPRPKIRWTKDGKDVEMTTRIKTEYKEDGNISLTIEKTEQTEAGEYKCHAENEHGSAWTEGPIVLTQVGAAKAEGEAPDFVQPVRPVVVEEGETAVLEGKISGKPTPTVKWYKNGEQLKDTDRVKIESLPDGTQRLTVKDATLNDTDEYRCEASNDYGDVWSDVTLTVKEKHMEAPEFVKELRAVAVIEGKKAEFECRISGIPKPEVKWFKDGEEVPTDARVHKESDSDGTEKLIIETSKVEDQGNYRIEVTNPAGTNNSKAPLTVTPAETLTIKKGLEDQKVVRGTKILLSVEVEGKPKTVKWYRDNQQVSASSTTKLEQVTESVYRLEISSGQPTDAGSYRVVLSTEVLSVESSCTVTVSEGVPTFKKGLTDQQVPKGTPMTLEVEIEGKPKAVKWYKGDEELKGEDLGDGKYRLVVPNFDDKDVGKYRVEAVNDDGKADSSAKADLSAGPKPEIVSGLVPTSVQQGETATFTVKVKGPVKAVKWYKNGKEIPDAKTSSPADGTYVLTLPDCQKDDGADYKVVVSNDAGDADSSAALTVKLPKLEITKGLEDQAVEKGKKAVLELKTNAKPKTVKWYKNGKELSPSDKAQPESDGTTHKLVIPDCQDEDAADYKVVLTGEDDTPADSSCALTVKLPAEEPRFVKGLEDTVLPVGAALTLPIQTTGSPKTVKWYKNGKELAHAAGKVNLKKIDNNNYVLEIPKSALEDGGDYKVEIENEAGKATSSGKVTVEPQLTFLKPLKDQEVVEGENAEFKVETNAKPRAVKWYKNGQEIKPDAHFVLSGDDKTYSLVIKGAVKEDAAEYKVVLSNSAGEADSSAKLTVKKAKPGAPKILKGLDDQVVAKGAALVFEVKVEGDVDTVRWLKDATPLAASANLLIEKVDPQTYRLTIPKADLSDAGSYAVELSNEGGKAKSDAKGEVDEKPEIVKGLEDTEVQEGDDDVLKVEVSAPVRTVKWYKNGQEIKPSGHLEPKKIGPKKYELAINKAQLDDGATYKVVLSNAAGECDSSAALTVTKPNILKILEGLKDVDVTEGEPLPLKVKVQGVPKIVKWYKNGQELAPSDRLKMKESPETGEFSLEIPSSEKVDGAAYRVVLTNEKGEVYSGCVAHVKTAKPAAGDVAANFLTPLQDTEVEEGETLTLTCKVGGEPFPEIKWEKDGVPLEKSDRIAMRTALDGTVTLRIRDCKKSDLGQYRVTATNPTGSATSACAVTVKEKGEEPSKPHFIIPLSSCSALVGTRKEFQVKVRGFPKPDLVWTLNGKPLEPSDRIVIEDVGAGNYCLTIRDVREEDFGTLKCMAKNELGSDETVAEFEQEKERAPREPGDDRYPPRFNVPLWDRRIPVNDLMTIECHVDAKPVAEIAWFKDGQPLQTTDRLEIRNSSDGACRVRIDKFSEGDCGVYKCVATNELGMADTQSIYSVEIPELVEEVKKKAFAPKFNPGLEDRGVNAGQSLRLSCAVTAEPRAAVTWYKDGLPLRADGRISLEYTEDGQCSLSIPEAKESDEGAYRCVATNEHGSINTSCLVTVKVPKTEVKKEGEEPFFTKNLVDVWTDRGDSFTLSCAVKGDPFPEIKWYRNGQLVRNSPRCVIETSPEGACTLTVKECTMSDEGIYRCEAENKHGKAKTQATAHVQMALGKSEKAKVEEGQPPRFIIPLSDTTVMLGSAIDLECKVTGQPMPHVKWSKDGGPIWEDSRYDWDIDEAKGTYHLRIKNCTVADEGTYRCVATNESGSATTKAFIRIDDGSGAGAPAGKTAPPRFSIKLGDARANEGQPLKLECKIEGFPLPELTWHKDGAQIQPSDRVKLTVDPDGTARLVIPQCTMDDEGIYRVIATNPSGSAHDKGNAVVKRLPRESPSRRSAERELYDSNKAPRLLEPLENVKVPEKEGFKLRCKWSGDPKPTIKWFKDGERVFPYGRLQLVEHPDGVCELIVAESTRHDAGGYRCVAENTYGSARTTCDVIVVPKERKPRDIEAALATGKAPGFTIPLTIRRAKPGEAVTFECLPYGTPFPAIKWLKDGIELVPGDMYTMESLPDGTQKLVVKDVTFMSEGYFRCVATNEHGTASTKAELVVEGDRSAARVPVDLTPREPEECKPRIRRGLYNMSIHQGNVVEMIVCATGWPTPTVKWYKDGQEIISDGPDGKRVIFTDERGIHHLVILNVGPEDEGEYSLEATNKLGSARTEGALNIIRPRTVGGLEGEGERGGMPFPPGFVRQLKNKHVFHHMPTIFDCLVVGHPAPEVEWFHNGKKIVPGGRIKIQSCGGGSHAIIILDTTTDDAGEYVAVAKNCHGTASSSAILDVTVPHLDNIKFNGEIDVTQYLTEEYGFKKINVASLPTPPDRGPFIKEVTGHYLTLSWIPTKRAPPRYPQVTYVIEIRELPEKEWTLLDYNIPEPVCKVRNLELGKSYQFRVRAENIYGISDPSPASPPSRLMAPPQPVLDKRTKKVIPLLDPYAERALDLAHAEQYACAPWFAPGVVEKRYCAENDTLTLILNVSGYPDPQIQWKFRGWDIDTTSPTSKCKVYTYGGTETTLHITGFSKENVGQYQCIATNNYGEAQQNIMVELATRPSFIQPLMNKTFSSAHPMRLDVRVEGEPFPELKWMKEWRPIVESTRVKFVQDGPYLCSLIINDPMWRDSGIYSCVAVNAAGQATTSCTVTVEADGDYNDVELPKKRVTMEARKVREIYEIEEEDEKLAAGGAPFRVKERKSGKLFLAQLKPYEETKRGLDIHNVLEHENASQYRQVIHDGDLAIVVFEDVTGTILENLLHPGVAVAEPAGRDREQMVQIFMRQLLLALEQMHGLRIAHLDLRPETILMQDGKLKLADFGQARRLLRGLITGQIRSNPEFVSPEVVRGYPLTLATDLWSVGTLAYVLLTGISPFHGDNDNETLANVDKAKISFDGPEWDAFSDDAKHFVANLLKEIPAERLTCSEALEHRWLAEEKIKNAQLPADGLREFNYKFKWLERRVFVQQTPSEQLLEAILAPSTAIAKPQPQPPAEGAGALEVYDYLRIKPRSPAPIEDTPPRRKPQSAGPVVPDNFADIAPEWLPPGTLPPPPEYHPRDPRRRPDVSPDRFGGQPGAQGSQGPPQKIPLDQFGRLVRPEDLARIPHDSFGRPLDLDQSFPREEPPRGGLGPIQQIPPFKGQPQQQQQQQAPQRPAPPPPDYAMTEKRKLVPQEKGETPSKTRKEPRSGREGDDKELGPEEMVQVPLRMIRGERRQIEEEIANRILSDISEEGSVAGSLASIDDLEPMLYEAKYRQRSPSETLHADDDSSTPTGSPVNTVKEGIFFPKLDAESLAGLPVHERELLERAENDPNIPVGAPLFLEGLTNATLTVETAPLPSPAALSPKSPRRSAPGTKSPVLLSPGREHTMEALIAMKRGKPQFLAPGEKAPEIDDEDAHMDKRKQRVKPGTHDSGFKDLQEELEKRKKVDMDDLEKYRPRNFYKDDVDFERPGYDIDASPWDSHYQIGPDTYLMASQGPSFNSRVRDYRRSLWGDGAPLVRQGILGYRNQDITVRERRRYTDILRETNQGLQPKQTDGSVMRTPSASAIDRIKADIQNVAPSATRKNADGTFAPIFISRLRDAYLGHASAVFEISVAGSPAPKVQWQFQSKPLEGDERRVIEQTGSFSRLTIQNPSAFDLGEYTCTASNEFGSDKTTSRLVSGEAPSRPGRPECELSSDTELFITWQPPEGPTYLEGITYRLEYRPAGPTELASPWVVISEHIDDEAVVVKHLEPMGVYQFRVTARNGVGLGVPSLSSRMVQTHGKGVPKLQVDLLKEHYRLNMVTLPQKSARQLNEISEESESEHGDVRQTDEAVELLSRDPNERFQIDALLCRGKFSVLRAAVDGQAEGSAQCVVKIRDSREPDCRREFKLLKDAQHENVQRLVAAYDCGGFMYLFCERLYEDVFSRFSFNDYYTEEQVAMTVRQLTSAIHWLHFRGVAHLDINPYNVMFQTKRNWIVKLVDFHSAQELSTAVKPSDINVLWAAPEMHVPDVPVTVQSDVWGMAVITFCLLGGFHPFYSEYDRPEEIKENVLNVKCDPNLIPVTASQEALSFVTWGLKKSPIRRMRTDEALSHKFLSTDPSMVRRREAAKYSASRLRKTITLTLPQPARPLSNELCNKFGEKNLQ